MLLGEPGDPLADARNEPARAFLALVLVTAVVGDPRHGGCPCAVVQEARDHEWVGRVCLDCDLDDGSVYAQLGERGVVLAEAHQSIGAIAASAGLAGLLGVQRRAPLLQVSRQAFDPDGTPLEWSSDTYRGDAFPITVDSRAALPRAGVALTLSAADAVGR